MFASLCPGGRQCLLLKSLKTRKISTSVLLCGSKQNFYETLGVKQDCTQKDIKNAFIELSKVHHPDSNASNSCDKNFKAILEAYQVLSKTHSRTNYDLSLRGIHPVNYVTNDTVHRPWESSSERRYGPVEDDSNYYGIRGVKKVSNWKIVMACVIFCAMGIIVQVFAIQKSFTLKRETMRTSIYNALYKKNREEALSNSDSVNLERVLNRMKERESAK